MYCGGGFKDFLCSPLFGEDEPILTNIFQRGWNHQPVDCWKGNFFRNYGDMMMKIENSLVSEFSFTVLCQIRDDDTLCT